MSNMKVVLNEFKISCLNFRNEIILVDNISKAYIFTDLLLISVFEILCNSNIHVLNDIFIELKHFVYMNKAISVF